MSGRLNAVKWCSQSVSPAALQQMRGCSSLQARRPPDCSARCAGTGRVWAVRVHLSDGAGDSVWLWSLHCTSPQLTLIKPLHWRPERCRPDSALVFHMFSGFSWENCRLFSQYFHNAFDWSYLLEISILISCVISVMCHVRCGRAGPSRQFVRLCVQLLWVWHTISGASWQEYKRQYMILLIKLLKQSTQRQRV